MAHLEGAYEQVNHRLASIDGRLDRIDVRLDRIDTRIDRLELKVDDLVKRIDSRFMWTVGFLLTVLSAILPLYFRR